MFGLDTEIISAKDMLYKDQYNAAAEDVTSQIHRNNRHDSMHSKAPNPITVK